MTREEKKMARVYISGAISGLGRQEYLDRFAFVELQLKAMGYGEVIDPTKLPPGRWEWLYRILGYRLTLIYDLYKLMSCTHYYQMPYSFRSKGSTVEVTVAAHFDIRGIDVTDMFRISRLFEDNFIQRTK